MRGVPPLNDLQFGFELEAVAPWPRPVSGSIWSAREYFTRRFARRTGLDVIYENRARAWLAHRWLLTQDGSITRDHPKEIDVELKSPILMPEVLHRLPGILTRCKTAGLQANESCGLHLHIGQRDSAWEPE
jgi:hypothetical protein